MPCAIYKARGKISRSFNKTPAFCELHICILMGALGAAQL